MNEHEFYPTPASAVRPLIDLGILPTSGRWLEPFAGNGAIIRAVPEVEEWWGIEIREEESFALSQLDTRKDPLCRFVTADLFSVQAEVWIREMAKPSVVISNPPNSRAFDAARLLREWCPQAWLAFLQPVGFGGGKTRMEWFSRHTPDHYRLAERPDFSRDGSGGLQDYAWFVWPPVGVRSRSYKGPRYLVPGYHGPHINCDCHEMRKRDFTGAVRTEGLHRILPPSGWVPSTQGVLL